MPNISTFFELQSVADKQLGKYFVVCHLLLLPHSTRRNSGQVPNYDAKETGTKSIKPNEKISATTWFECPRPSLYPPENLKIYRLQSSRADFGMEDLLIHILNVQKPTQSPAPYVSKKHQPLITKKKPASRSREHIQEVQLQ